MTMKSRIWSRVCRVRKDDEGVALLMSLLVIVMAASLSVAVAGSILNQVQPSQLMRKLTNTVSAAEAGIDVAAAKIKAADAAGQPLPCEVTGDVGTGELFTVSVVYYKHDPAGKPDQWLALPGAGGNRFDCVGGFFSPPVADDWWAVLTSKGSSASEIPGSRVGAGNRTLTAQLSGASGPCVATAAVPCGPCVATAAVPCGPCVATPTVPCGPVTSGIQCPDALTSPPPGALLASPHVMLVGTDGPDIIWGSPGPDVIVAGGGDDIIYANGGHDRMTGDAGNDRIDGGDGHDTLTGDLGDDAVCGGEGDDRFTGDPGDDYFSGGSGDDTLDTGIGNDIFDAGPGEDRVDAGEGNDVVHGGPGRDVLFGGRGNDVLHGDDGDDRLAGWYGDDELFGGAGADELGYQGPPLASADPGYDKCTPGGDPGDNPAPAPDCDLVL